MTTIKEMIEELEVRLGALQDGMQRMKLALTNKLCQIEAIINRLSKALLSNNNGSFGCNEIQNDEILIDCGQQIFPYKLVELEFPRYFRDDPIERLNRVDQFFEYQGTIEKEEEEK